MSDFPFRKRGADAVTALVASVRAEPGCIAGCFVSTTGQGFAMELEYLQRDDGTTRYRVWSDVQGVISTEERGALHDFAAALRELRAGTGVRDGRRADPGRQGHYALVVLADRDSGHWVEAPTPGRREQPDDDPISRLLAMVFA